MMYEEKIEEAIVKVGGTITKGWYPVSERPERPPFAKEIEYQVGDLFWGKVHLRNEGDIYILVISKDVFNWKDRISQLKVSGEVEDAAGGLLWLRESLETLENDFKYIKDYLSSLRSSKK